MLSIFRGFIVGSDLCSPRFPLSILDTPPTARDNIPDTHHYINTAHNPNNLQEKKNLSKMDTYADKEEEEELRKLCTHSHFQHKECWWVVT
jgi:hypothetical protein